MKNDYARQVLTLARERTILTPKDLVSLGIPTIYLARLCRRGILEKTTRGLYRLVEADITENHSLAEVCKKIPQAVVCLLSALRFHNIGTQLPHEVWIAIDQKARRPKLEFPVLRVVRFSKQSLTEGVEKHMIECVIVRVYSPAKTVVDCFKYRNKIGLDVALEALKECKRYRRATNDELWKYAKICRVWNVMRPYLEAMV